MPKILALAIVSFLPLISLADEQSHADAARELLVLMHSEEELDNTYAQIVPYMQKMIGGKGEDEESNQVFQQHFARVMHAMRDELNWEKMEPLMIEAYVSVYSEIELRELSQFYASPIGQKFVAKKPELIEASMRIAMQMMEDFKPRLQEMQDEFREELKANRKSKEAQQDAAE